ncbi:hypothetical protein BLA15945_06075 [Burkholderia lata]|uniref:Uncharacterized protein n=1 Tax=Burkholderia lata (strain ATCC 17760 / DSM 23089 / LMG 22485 / NCIMB 9086 / R18194 / 383) TaxID=482957 RepID=A0A6P2QPU9_BURL3|nr:hypothetical protein BLA15945_06075 [Burkholderia lata]
MSIKTPGADLKIASVHDGPIVHGGAGHTLMHAVGCIAQADRVQPRRIPSGACVPERCTRPSSACRCLHACATAAICRCCRLRSGDGVWPMTTTGRPHPCRRRAGPGRDVPVRRAPDHDAALRGTSVGTTDFTRGDDDSSAYARLERHACRRASAPRNVMRDAVRLITACNGRAGIERAVRRRDTMRPSGSARDYVASGMRYRPFPGISVEITGNRPPPFCGKVVFATD